MLDGYGIILNDYYVLDGYVIILNDYYVLDGYVIILNDDNVCDIDGIELINYNGFDGVLYYLL